MYQAVLPFFAFSIFALVTFRWTTEEMQQQGHLSSSGAAAVSALVLMHAMIVVIAAGGGALAVDVPLVPRVVAGAVVGVPGLALVGAAVTALGSKSVVFGQRTDTFTTSGVYGRMRHPLFVGWTLALLGVAIAGASILALVLVGILAAVLLRMRRAEADRMSERFGTAYTEWTPRRPSDGDAAPSH